LRHLFECWHEVVKLVKEATRVLLFLDYDGTLTPIVAKPEMAVLSYQAREILKQIGGHSLFRLAIISGRSLSEIKALVGLENIAYAGNHGLEIDCPPSYCQEQDPGTVTFTHPVAEEFQPRLRMLEQRLRKRLTGIDGVLIENKGLTLSIHYRLAEETAVKKIRDLSLAAVEYGEASDELQIIEGKKVLEVRPAVEWNKGKAIERLLEIYGTPGSLPIFIGDDVTDEDGFRVLQGVGGISIFVGEDRVSTGADYYLGSPDQLYHWLEKVVGIG
jgi:trehalose 6-phosphate phosphatase